MRTGEYTRETRETKITAMINLDGEGEVSIDSGIMFLDHKLTSLATHILIDITVNTSGDLRHHVVEDTTIVLGEALNRTIQLNKRITRFADASVPMDECLAKCSIDLGGRPYHVVELGLENPMTEDMANEDITHFMETLATSLRANIHIQIDYGYNDHHKAEAAFKTLARCLRDPVSIDSRRTEPPSSKGTL